MICPKCAREMDSEANVCPNCGFTFQTPKESGDAPHAPYARAPFAEPPAAPSATPSVEEKNAPAPANTPAYTYSAFSPISQIPERSVPSRFRNMENTDEALSILQYLGMILLSFVPVVSLVVFIIWAASRSMNLNCRRFAAAMLILKALCLILLLGAGVVLLVFHTPLYFYFFR